MVIVTHAILGPYDSNLLSLFRNNTIVHFVEQNNVQDPEAKEEMIKIEPRKSLY